MNGISCVSGRIPNGVPFAYRYPTHSSRHSCAFECVSARGTMKKQMEKKKREKEELDERIK